MVNYFNVNIWNDVRFRVFRVLIKGLPYLHVVNAFDAFEAASLELHTTGYFPLVYE